MTQLCRIVSLFLILLVCGCGFQLRGAVNLPAGVEPIYIGGVSTSSQLAVELRNLLAANGVKLTTELSTAKYRLQIIELTSDRRTASLGERARVAEYQLIETVFFELRDPENKTVLGPRKISELKIMPNDPNKVVSTAEEEKLLRREMLQNMAAKIARQLRSYDYQASTTSDH